MKTALVLVARLQRKIWLRAALWTLGAVAFALAAGLAAPLLTFAPTLNLGQGSVGTILQIIATSMLTVTTFSLTTMVTAYSSASAVATPRATQLLVDDPTSQTALSTFIGAFVYSLVGIIALSTGYYGDEGRTVLFLGTIVVIAVIVITLLRWIAHLSTFGRMADVIDRVEDAACTVVTAYGRRPTWGAQRSSAAPGSQFRGVAIDARETGCVTLIDFAALQRIAERVDADLHVASMPGRTVNPATPLAFVGAEVDDETSAEIAHAFRVERHRTYERDPRLGLIALAEIGSRALSPATNDPGSAIEVLGAMARVFASLFAQTLDDTVSYDRVWVTPVTLDELVDDAFRPIARDGAGMIELVLRLQKTLASLAATSPDPAPFRRAARESADRANSVLHALDRKMLRDTRRALKA